MRGMLERVSSFDHQSPDTCMIRGCLCATQGLSREAGLGVVVANRKATVTQSWGITVLSPVCRDSQMLREGLRSLLIGIDHG